jgi:maleate cis-trans isomerase
VSDARGARLNQSPALQARAPIDEMGRLRPEDILDFTRRVVRKADACLLSCTAIPLAAIMTDLETALGMRVLPSNQAMVWRAPRLFGVEATVPGFGQRMQHSGRASKQKRSGLGGGRLQMRDRSAVNGPIFA